MADPEFTLLGDALWLDFVNSAGGRTPAPPDLLPDLAAYHRWTKANRLVPDIERRPFGELIAFRDRLKALAEALHGGEPSPPSAVEAINAALAASPGARQLVRVGGTWRLRFTPAVAPAALAAIALSAATTLADPAVRVRRCAGAACSLFIADGSAAQTRLWCAPEICGAGIAVERRRGLLR